MKRIGIEPGKSFDFDKARPRRSRRRWTAAPTDAQQLMTWKVPTLARVVNGWSMNTDTMGVYGNYYLKRAIVAQVGLGANLPEDAIYPLNLADDDGKPLDGANKYMLHFDKGATPPVDAFWSVTLYDADGFQVANTLNRFAVGSWMPFKYNADGSLDLYFQNESPGADKEANWLPAPKGPFNLTMRLYAPKSEALDRQVESAAGRAAGRPRRGSSRNSARRIASSAKGPCGTAGGGPASLLALRRSADRDGEAFDDRTVASPFSPALQAERGLARRFRLDPPLRLAAGSRLRRRRDEVSARDVDHAPIRRVDAQRYPVDGFSGRRKVASAPTFSSRVWPLSAEVNIADMFASDADAAQVTPLATASAASAAATRLRGPPRSARGPARPMRASVRIAIMCGLPDRPFSRPTGPSRNPNSWG